MSIENIEVPKRLLTPKRLRFSPDDDLALLREFVNNNPLNDTGKWDIIQKNVLAITGKNFKIRTLKDHVFLLLDMWKQKDSKNQKSSGVEEVYSERDQLLQEIADICKDSESIVFGKRKRPLNKEKQIVELGKKARDSCLPGSSSQSCEDFVFIESEELPVPDHDYVTLADEPMETFIDDSVLSVNIEVPLESCEEGNKNINIIDEGTETGKEVPIPSNKTGKENITKKRILGPTRRKNNKSSSIRKNALDYLSQKEEKERELREKELGLKERHLELCERRMALEEKRFELESLERKDLLEMAKQRTAQDSLEKEQHLNIIASQQKFIQSLMENISKDNTE